MTGCYVLLLLLLTGRCWAGKQCCDSSCSEVISYGTTITRHISKHQDYLSFPRNALVEVYAKIEDPDVWLVKYGNKKGFVPQKMILEKTVTCEELIYIDEKETDEESANDEQVNDDSLGNHGDQAPSSEPVMVTIPTPVDTPGNGGHDINDMIREDEKEQSESSPTTTDDTPTGETREEDNEMSEKTFHDDTSGSTTMPPQVDLHDNEKPVEPVEPAKQDSDQYKPQLDDEEEKIFEFNTEEEFNQWSDHMIKDRAHMSNEGVVYEDSEAAYDKDEDDNNVEEENMGTAEDRAAEEEKEDLENEDVKKEEAEVDEDEEAEDENEDKDEEEEEREEEDQKEVQEVDIEQNNKEDMFEGSSEIGHEEGRHTLPHMTSHDDMTSHDHEQHQQQYSPSDVDTPTDDDEDDDDDDDPELFEKIAEELAASNKQPTEWEELVEKELDDKTVTMVTDTLDINPTATHDHTDTVTSVVMATVHSNGMLGNGDTQDDNSEVEQLSNTDEKDNEIVNEQLEHLVIDDIQEAAKHSDNGEIQQKYEQDNLNISESSESQQKYEQDNLNISESSESQQKYEQDNLNISESSESQQKYEQDNLNISESSESQQKYEQEHYSDSEIPEIRENKEELGNNEIQLNISDLDQKTDSVLETKNVRDDDPHLAEHGVGEEEKRDEETQQDIDDLVKQKDEEHSQREEEDKNIEEQNSQQKDEKEEKIEQQKDAEDEKDEKEEDKHENNDKDVEDEKKEDIEQQQATFLQEVQQPSVASVTVVEVESTSTSVTVTTHDIPMPHATQSVTMTTNIDSDMEGDSSEVSEEKTVEVVRKPPPPPITSTAATAHHHDDQLRDTDSRQSEDVFMSEKHHHTKRSLIVSYLPSFLADMLVDVDDNLVYTILGTMAAILLPCCVMSCRSSIKSNKQRRELENVKAKCRSVDEKVVKLEEEKKQLLIKYNTELGKCQSVEELLSAEKQNMALLQQANNEVNELLLSTQAQLQQYQSHNDQLVGELTTERQLHATQISATQEAQQELMATRSHLQQASQQVSELEATREQLEQELFTVKQSTDELQAAHLKLQQSHDEVTQRCGSLDEQLVSVSGNLETTESLVKEKDDELKLLRECLLQLQSDESDDDVDKETESNGHRKVLSRKNSKIEKVHAMLDTTKVQTELKSVKEERGLLQQQLESKIQTLQQLEDELEQTKRELTKVRGEQDELSLKHAETEIKLNTLTEYFERKEQNLHRKLGVEEAARQEIENREATAKEKVSLAEEERAKEREELQQLRQQMSEIEKSLMQQVVTNEKRAQEALAQLRRTEQELRLANRELNDLKKRLSGSRPTSPGGSETGRIPPHPPPAMLRRQYSPPPERYHEPVPVRRRPPSTGPRMESRPLSAPRFPRTSSPSELDHHPPVPGRQLNDTYPGHSRPLPQPHPPRDSYSLDDRDRLILRGPDEGKSLPPPSLHHHPRSMPPHKSSERMDRPIPMSDRPPLPQSISDHHHHPLPPRYMPPGPRGDPNMPARRPPLYQPHPGAVRAPPPHDPSLRRPGPPPTVHNRQPPSLTEQAKPSDQHKMEV